MRVLVSCLQAQKKHAVSAYEFWRPYFIQGCVEAGLEPVEIPGVDWVEPFTLSGEDLASWRSRTWETVVDFVRKEHAASAVSFFLSYFYPQHIDEGAIKEIQRIGVPCVNFFCDNFRLFRKAPAPYSCFDLHWVPEFEALPLYKKAGLPFIHAAMPCWIPTKFREPPACESEPATFIGGRDELRWQFLGRALEGGAKFVIRGPGWRGGATDAAAARKTYLQLLRNQVATIKHWGLLALVHKIGARLAAQEQVAIGSRNILEPVFGDDYFRVSREAKITIGVNRFPRPDVSNRRPLTYSRLRDIEAPMLGACYLSEWTEGLEHLYDLGTEIETYRTADEPGAKLDFLAADSAKRQDLRRRAQRRALADHTVARTLHRVIDRLGVSCS